MAKDKKEKKGKEKAPKPEKEKKGKDKKSKDKKGSDQKPKGSADAQIVRKLDGSIALSKLQHVMMEKKNKKGKKILGIFIPVKANYLVEGKEGAIYMNLRMNLKDKEDTFGQHGFISQVVPSDQYKAASDEEKEEMKKTPILGGLKDWEFTSTSNDNSGAAAKGTVDEDDDLPF